MFGEPICMKTNAHQYTCVFVTPFIFMNNSCYNYNAVLVNQQAIEGVYAIARLHAKLHHSPHAIPQVQLVIIMQLVIMQLAT